MIKQVKRQIYLSLIRRKFPTCVIHPGVSISADSVLNEYVSLFSSVHVLGSRIGRFTYVQSSSEIICADIGPFCSISKNVLIGAAEHVTNEVSTSPVFYDASQPLPLFLTSRRMVESTKHRTSIGADTWIGTNCVIRSGVSIGIGAIIGASSVITKDVEPYSIVVGAPGREVGKRFNQDLIAQLLSSHWWDLDESILLRLSSYFSTPEEFLLQLKALK
jgi:acetyltransferase-like isoleucine patch superfamily enzyme